MLARVVQGHPKLLELADAAAADRTRLDAQLAAAEDATSGASLEAFFRDGASALGPAQFLTALTGWTTAALAVLPPPARLLAEFLACLEDADRQSPVIGATWPNLWRQLDRPGDPPDPPPLLDALAAAPYLLRRHDWDTASTLLEHALGRDHSPGAVAASRPATTTWRSTWERRGATGRGSGRTGWPPRSSSGSPG